MTLIFVVKVPEGLVLAAESRATVIIEHKAKDKEKKRMFAGTYDNMPKTLSFENYPYVGAVTCGQAAIGLRAIHTYLKELEASIQDRLGRGRPSILDFSKELSNFFVEKWKTAQMPETAELSFFVAGFDEGETYGRIYSIKIPSQSEPVEELKDKFRIIYAGQTLIVDRLLKGYDSMLKPLINSLNEETKKRLEEELDLAFLIPYVYLSLQDAANLAVFLISMTIRAQEFALTHRGCGGEIDICTITQEKGLNYIHCKSITDEQQSYMGCVR